MVIHFINMGKHYNHFTISYIEIICKYLKIEKDSSNNFIYLPEFTTDEDLTGLKDALGSIWIAVNDSVTILQEKKDSRLQSCLFGVVNDFDLAMKTGYLISDRVVLVDYVYGRLLSNTSPGKIDKEKLGVVATNLASCLELAKAGRIVIIPMPLNWFPETKELITIASSEFILNPALMSLLSILSIAKKLNLLPFTIAESDNEYMEITKNQIDATKLSGSDIGTSSYKSILGALLSEKILRDSKFSILLNLPLEKYSNIIASNKGFYLKFISRLTEGSSLYEDVIIDEISENLQREIIENDKSIFDNLNIKIGGVIGVAGAAVSVVAAFADISAIAKISGAALSLFSRFSGLFKQKSPSEDKIIIAVFRTLYKAT